MNPDDIIRMSQEAGPLVSTPFDVWRDRFAALVAAYEREQCARLVKEMVEKNYDLDDFANSVRAGAMRLCSDGRPKWLKVSMEVAAEREACERLVWDTPEPDDEYVSHREAIAAAIRARGEK